jgi:hypothetical protein
MLPSYKQLFRLRYQQRNTVRLQSGVAAVTLTGKHVMVMTGNAESVIDIVLYRRSA